MKWPAHVHLFVNLFFKELEGRSFGQLLSLSKYMGFAIITFIPMRMRYLEEFAISIQHPVAWFPLDSLSISFCIISGLPLLDTGFHGFLSLLQFIAD